MEALNGMTLLETLEDECTDIENFDDYLLDDKNQDNHKNPSTG